MVFCLESAVFCKKEAKKRMLVLRWTSVTLSDVGFSVCASVVIMSQFAFHVFFHCAGLPEENLPSRYAVRYQVSGQGELVFWLAKFAMLHCSCWQEGLHGWEIHVNGPWNAGAEIPLHKWLQTTQSEEDQKRLVCMGNIVVPLQASQGFKTLSRMHI